jgi:DNA-binding MarR family transcriptional regulator
LFLKPANSSFDLHGTGLCASFHFRRATRAVTRLYDQALQTCGIRSTQFTILVSVAKTQPTSISALSSLLIIDSTTLTRSLSLLQKEGLLTVSPRSVKRQRFVNLTPSGEKLLGGSLPAWRAVQARFVEALGSEFWLKFRGELERLSNLVVSLESPESKINLADKRR